MTFHEQRQAERRAASNAAIARHFAECDRRVAERRAQLTADLGDWQRRYDDAARDAY